MRKAILWAPKVGQVSGTAGEIGRMRMLLADRIANGEAFPGEIVVRLPRRRNRR
jgi:hypothetical protein